ncbi:MAG: hypothetical protein ACLQG3_05585 [Terracidiphilus sp.]
MKHFDEEELIEHYYGEDRDPCSAARHIAECAECAANYAALQADLFDVRSLDLPFRDPGWGERIWESIAGSLPERPGRKPSWMRPAFRRGLVYAAAIAVLVAATFYAGRMWEHSKTPVTAAKPAAPAPPRVVVVVLSDHLDRSERLLVELKHADAGSPEMLSPLGDEARGLLPANRICEKEAESSDDPELEKTLASLDRLLTGLVGRPEGLSAADVARLQKEMKADGLLFEVRMLRVRIPARNETKGIRSEGGAI